MYWNSYLNQSPASYELEWMHVDNYTESSLTTRSTSNIFYDFRRNSTRVQIKDTFYVINDVFERGYVLCRVRRLRPDSVDFKTIRYSDWAPSSTNGSVASFITTCSSCALNVSQHEDILNWQYQSSYAEDGKRKENLSYLDGTQRPRQEATLSNSTQITIV